MSKFLVEKALCGIHTAAIAARDAYLKARRKQ